jgi:hypothetical protein
LQANGVVLVTAPCFQFLFTNHDRALLHFRRYSLGRLETVLRRNGYEVLRSGYLFASLILPRFVSRLAEVVRTAGNKQPGIGAWRAPGFVTRSIELVFRSENWILIRLARIGIKIPGLSAWTLCRRLSS